MAHRFRYKAASAEGRIYRGLLEAEDALSAKKALDLKGLIPISVEPKSGYRPILKRFFKPSPDARLVSSFSRKLGALYNAGIPIIRALSLIESEQDNAGFKQALGRMGQSIAGGMTLSQSMEQFPEYFSGFFVNTIKAGEASGRLVEILHQLSDLLEREIRTKQTVETAIRYPIYVLITVVLAVAVVVTVVVPRFADFYRFFEADLPLPTRFLIDISNFVTSYWYVVVLGAILAVLSLNRFRETSFGRNLLDRIKLEVPILGAIFLRVAISRFCFILGTLLRAGLPLVESLRLSEAAVGNSLISKVVSSAADNISGGGDLISPLKTSKYFRPMVIQMLSIGMESGGLDDQLFQIGQYYDEVVEYQSKKLTSRLEPLLTVFVSGLVLFLALSIFLPMWNIINVVRNW